MRRMVMTAAIAAAAAGFAYAQTPSAEVTVTGCVQRAPSSLGKATRFELMGASISDMGGATRSDMRPAEPPRPPVQATPREPKAEDREDGGVSYALEGETGPLESRIGERVEVTGVITGRVSMPVTRPSTATPMQRLRVRRVRAIGARC